MTLLAFQESFKTVADAIESGSTAAEAASTTLKENFRCVFNGNNYSDEWPIEAEERGVWRIDSGVEALARYVLIRILLAQCALTFWSDTCISPR